MKGEEVKGGSSAGPRPRIQTLSDLIFGLALSIGAFGLLSAKPSDTGALILAVGLFGYGFLILAIVWLSYTRIMSSLPVETGNIVAAIMLLLFLVSIEPYLFNLISFNPPPGVVDQGTVTAAYAIDMGLMFLILAYFLHELTIEEKRLVPSRFLRHYRLRRNGTLINALLFLISSIPFFWTLELGGIQLRWVLWFLTFPAFLVRRFVERRGA